MTTLLRSCSSYIYCLPRVAICKYHNFHHRTLKSAVGYKHGMSLIPRWFCVDAPGNGRSTAGAVALLEALKIQNPIELSLRGKFCFSVIV